MTENGIDIRAPADLGLAQNPGETALDRTGEKPAILMVDDDVDCCLVMKDIFEDLGYRVDAVQDQAAAFALLERHSYQVALVDLYLTGADGLTLLKEIRALLPTIASFLFTGAPIDPRIAQAIGEGVTGIVRKPVDVPQLRVMIARVLGPPAGETRSTPGLLSDELAAFVETEIHRQTARRVRDLNVASTARGCRVSGRTDTYYVKQLLILAALQAVNGAMVVEFDVNVASESIHRRGGTETAFRSQGSIDNG